MNSNQRRRTRDGMLNILFKLSQSAKKPEDGYTGAQSYQKSSGSFLVLRGLKNQPVPQSPHHQRPDTRFTNSSLQNPRTCDLLYDYSSMVVTHMKLTTKSDQEILAIAIPIMDNLMEGSTKINHTKHTKIFHKTAEEHLKQICRCYQAEWGYFSRREFVAVFRRLSSVAIIWKQWCSKQDGELVAEIVLVEHDSKYLVDHALVF